MIVLLKRVVRAALDLVRRVSPPEHRDVAADHSLLVPFGFPLDPGTGATPRIAVVCHVFHPHLLGELAPLLANVPGHPDLLITTDTEDKRRAIAEALARADGPDPRIRLVPNRGRDIAPKLTAFADEYADYDLLLFLHTKHSSHGGVGAAWRTTLLQSLAGSGDVARSIVQLFQHEREVGLVMPQHYAPVRPWLSWNENWPRAAVLAARAGFRLPLRGPIDFPAGSMFWARPAAVAPLVGLGLTPADFPAERGQVNRTVHHAVERLFLFSCEHSGYRWLKVTRPDAETGGAPAVEVRGWDEVRVYTRDRSVRLLPASRGRGRGRGRTGRAVDRAAAG